MSQKIALGRDIQDWLIRGLEHVALHTPPPDTLEMQAMLTILREAELVMLLLPDHLEVADTQNLPSDIRPADP